MKVSEPFREELVRLLESAVVEVIATREAYRAAQVNVHLKYDLVCILAKYLRQQGVDAPIPEPPPKTYGVLKTRRLEREQRRKRPA